MRPHIHIKNMKLLVAECIAANPRSSLSEIRKFLEKAGYSGMSQSTLVEFRRAATTIVQDTRTDCMYASLYDRYVQLKTYVMGGHLDTVRSKMDELYEELKKHGSKKSKILWMELLEAIQDDTFIQDLEKEDAV